MELIPLSSRDYPALVDIWEGSVRATHHFLHEADLVAIRKRLVPEFFPAVDLTGAERDGRITGFAGVAEGKLEMLFVAPDCRSQGVGRALVAHVIATRAVVAVDVNEQNEAALGFYLHCGFEVTGRSAVDGLGKPYPLLHLRLAPR